MIEESRVRYISNHVSKTEKTISIRTLKKNYAIGIHKISAMVVYL